MLLFEILRPFFSVILLTNQDLERVLKFDNDRILPSFLELFMEVHYNYNCNFNRYMIIHNMYILNIYQSSN